MTPEPVPGSGTLAEALDAIQKRVKSDPSNSRQRVALFEMLALIGQWERALTQIDVLREMDAKTLPMAQTYREAVRCEALRAEVFAGRRSPLVFGKPEEWIALLIEALRVAAEGQDGHADELRAAAFEAAAATAGRMRRAIEGKEPADRSEDPGEAFEWIADADSRLGPVLEAVVLNRYYWIPFARIRTLAFEKPADLRDFVWTPAQIQWANGGEAVGLIPTRYPGSEASADDALRMARQTMWTERTPHTVIGLGQRMLATDQGEIALLDLRRLDLEPVQAEVGAEAPEGSRG